MSLAKFIQGQLGDYPYTPQEFDYYWQDLNEQVEVSLHPLMQALVLRSKEDPEGKGYYVPTGSDKNKCYAFGFYEPLGSPSRHLTEWDWEHIEGAYVGVWSNDRPCIRLPAKERPECATATGK